MTQEEFCTCERTDNYHTEQRPTTRTGSKMDRYCLRCNKITEKNVEISTYEGLIRAFVHKTYGKKKVVRNYRIQEEKKRIVYRPTGTTGTFSEPVILMKSMFPLIALIYLGATFVGIYKLVKQGKDD